MLVPLPEDGVTIDKLRWPSVEHFYQSQKYIGTEAVDRIRQAEMPLKARKAGQDRSLTPCSNWDEIKAQVMLQAIRAKFEQNRRLREKLSAAGDEELIHKSETDLFWGQSQEGMRDNRLGAIIMEVRKSLRDAKV